jgi:hypothetical protein
MGGGRIIAECRWCSEPARPQTDRQPAGHAVQTTRRVRSRLRKLVLAGFDVADGFQSQHEAVRVRG